MTDKKARENEISQPRGENEISQPRGVNEVSQAPGTNEAFIRTDIPHIPGMIIHVTNDSIYVTNSRPMFIFRSEEKEE